VLTAQDSVFLANAIRNNACVLFLGAGFSRDAVNAGGTALPGGGDLGREFWTWLGYDRDHAVYDPLGSPLDKLFQVARAKRRDRAVLEFLRQRLHVAGYPDWYKRVAYPYWYRIYTTNVDDLVETIFREVQTTRLAPVNAIKDLYRERDRTLEMLQYVKLNGTLTDTLEHLTFSPRQFAARASKYDPWYDHFVRDYCRHTTILVGTEVNEPLFWQAVNSRGGRGGAAIERRLRSFLVSPTPSPVLVDSLAEFNVVPVRATAKDFFEYLAGVVGDYPAYEEIIVQVNPQLAFFRDALGGDKRDTDALKTFLNSFTRVEVPERPASYRPTFLLGAAPTFDDIALDLDARLEVTERAYASIHGASADPTIQQFIVVAGHRGCGKSTLLMRTAVDLAAAGTLVFIASGEDVPDYRVVARALERIDRPAVLIIDDAEWLSASLAEMVGELGKIKRPPTLVVGLRANAYHVVEEEGILHQQVWFGNLTDPDIEAVIEVLERENMLGTVTGRKHQDIHAAFRHKAGKQLLVAMREVTTGQDFDVIITKEFQDIEDPELRITYLAACLASSESASLSREQLLAASELPPARLLAAIDRELRQMLVPVPGTGDRWVARHQVIAETVVERAPKVELAEAYKRLLAVLAHDMDPRAKRGSEGRRWFRLYKRLVNHRTIYHRFEKNVDEARAIFDSLTPLLTKDSQFWLQYGSLELEYGELDLASPYVASAESLDPDDWYIQNAKGHLLLAQGKGAGSLSEATRLRQEGEEILEGLIRAHGEESSYPWHTLVSHTLDWLGNWEHDPGELRRELERLRTLMTEACETRAGDVELDDLRKRVERAYLATAVARPPR
jgi:tetratricopeptide (TPR) repeat protein